MSIASHNGVVHILTTNQRGTFMEWCSMHFDHNGVVRILTTKGSEGDVHGMDLGHHLDV